MIALPSKVAEPHGPHVPAGEYGASAPPAEAFAAWSMSWCAFARSRQLDRGPVSVDLFGRRLVGYRTAAGRAVVMDGRCWHLGADLSDGRVVDDCVQCPFHGWRFDASGACVGVPATSSVPPEARQQTCATSERGGTVWAFRAAAALYPLPFFEGVKPDELVGAPPFEFRLRCPWWLVGTNGFDLQHFAGAHDRRLVAAPEVSTPHPAARRIIAEFDVCGPSWRDRLTRRYSGPRVRMDVTVWGGSLAFVAARFHGEHDDGQATPRTTSFGMVEIRPCAEIAGGSGDGNDAGSRTLVRVHIFVRRRSARLVPAALDARVRSRFIRAFLEPDARLLDGVRYNACRLIEADRVMIDYLRWLAPVSHGRLPATGEQP